MSDRAAVDLAHRDQSGESAGDEGLVGAIDIVEREGLLEDGNAILPHSRIMLPRVMPGMQY